MCVIPTAYRIHLIIHGEASNSSLAAALARCSISARPAVQRSAVPLQAATTIKPSSCAPCIANEGCPVLGLPFTAWGARSAVTPLPPSFSTGAAQSPASSNLGPVPMTQPQAPHRRRAPHQPLRHRRRPPVPTPIVDSPPPERAAMGSHYLVSPFSHRPLYFRMQVGHCGSTQLLTQMTHQNYCG
jgi:hypothetical protein